MVVDIARHLRDEAGQMLDAEFDVEAKIAVPPAPTAGACCAPAAPDTVGTESCGCTPTAKGNACC